MSTTLGNIARGKASLTLAAGALAAFAIALGSLADVAISMATGGGVPELPPPAALRFAQLAASPALGLYNLDLLNLATTILIVPVLYAAWTLLRREGPAAGLALAIGLVGVAVFAANNPALPMLGLSRDYAVADPSRRSLLAAAGEAILAKGAHGSPGVLLGFLFPIFANALLCGEMIRTKVFSRISGILGLVGNLLLALYLALVTFVPESRAMAAALAAPGGLLAIAWTILLGLRLIKPSRAKPEDA
jgi:hypothetical protein